MGPGIYIFIRLRMSFPENIRISSLAEEWSGAGMKGGVIKCHYADTTGRAAMLRSLFPGLKVYGGLVLNRQAGGLNPDAAERMAQAGENISGFPPWIP